MPAWCLTIETMKHKLKPIIAIASALAALASCNDDIVWNISSDSPTSSDFAGMYILCEGLFNMNNSIMSYYDFQSGSMLSFEDSDISGSDKTSYDFFKMVNGRKLGDTANDLKAYGSQLWCVVNVSSQVEVMQLSSGRSLGQIPLLGDTGAGRQPREVAFWGGKAYVCSFDGTVAMIDTATFEVDKFIEVGRNPDGICVVGDKLYVSNSGGLDVSNPDNTVSVIDLHSFTETKRITVGENPGVMAADADGNLYVVARGRYDYDAGNYDSRLVRINTSSDTVKQELELQAINLCIYGYTAYICASTNSGGAVVTLDTRTGEITDYSFVKDGTTFTNAYAIEVNPYTGDVYIADAQNYTVNGTVSCFGSDGIRKFVIDAKGINPNSIVFLANAAEVSSGNGGSSSNEDLYVSQVFDYTPAAGQFVNLMPAYETGDDAESMCAKCLDLISQGQVVSLGGFGGSITVGLNRRLANTSGQRDFRVLGNAFDGSAEPGIVMVSRDDNGNGLPDDTWYELRGSEYDNPATVHGYAVTYYRPQSDNDPVAWVDNLGGSGYIERTVHEQSFYPLWIAADSLTLHGSCLPSNASYDSGSSTWVMSAYSYGYADNHPNNSNGSCMDLDWAVDADGNYVELDYIDFVRIYTAVNVQIPTNLVGELSTEFAGIEPVDSTG